VCKIKVGRVKLSSGPHQKRRQIAIFRSGNVTPTKAVWSQKGVIAECQEKTLKNDSRWSQKFWKAANASDNSFFGGFLASPSSLLFKNFINGLGEIAQFSVPPPLAQSMKPAPLWWHLN
jgi:hypothetical protein